MTNPHWTERATITERYQKACDSPDATASGPRPIMSHHGGTTFSLTWARFACDECDTPWEKTAGAHTLEEE